MNKVIVTGANGFIGSSLIQKLVANGIRVVALDISFAVSHLPDSDLIETVETTLDTAEGMLEKIPAGIYDVFYHFAWQGVNGADKADPAVQLKNCQMAINCAAVAKKLNCKKFLCAGTIAEQAVVCRIWKRRAVA